MEQTTIFPTCSVCIANYNGIDVIDNCIRSVVDQTGNIPIEIIVHDDASTDGSVAHIREHYPEVLLIESKKNVGFCTSNNRMVTKARGKYVLLLNNDAALFPDALATLHQVAESKGTPCVLGLPQYEWGSGRLLDRGSLLDPFLNSVPNMDSRRAEVGLVAGACLWIPKSMWDELGGFPEWFGSIAEDLLLCCLARLEGYSVEVLGTSGYCHRVGWSFGGGKVLEAGRLVTNRSRRSKSERNKIYVMVLCFPLPMLVLLLPLHLILLMLEGTILSLIKKDAGLWRSIYAGLVPELWQAREKLRLQRKIIQGRRVSSLARWISVFRILPYKLEMLLKHGLPEVQ